jgi:hypothetical protein
MDKRHKRGWLLGLLTAIVAVIVLIRRRMEPIDSAPLLPAPTPPPSDPPRIVLPAALVEAADTVPEALPAGPAMRVVPSEAEAVAADMETTAPEVETEAPEVETEAPLLEREVGGSAGRPVQSAPQPTVPRDLGAPDIGDAEDEQHIGYCVSCRAKRPMQDAHEETTENDRRALRGTCPVCGNTIFRFLPNKD